MNALVENGSNVKTKMPQQRFSNQIVNFTSSESKSRSTSSLFFRKLYRTWNVKNNWMQLCLFLWKQQNSWDRNKKLTSGWFQILQHTAKAFRGFETHLIKFKFYLRSETHLIKFEFDLRSETHLWKLEFDLNQPQYVSIYLFVISSSMNRRYRVR